MPLCKHRPLRGGGSGNGFLALDCTHRDALGKVLLEGQEHDDDGHGGQGGTENADTTQGTQEVTDDTEGTQESQENHDGNHSGENTDMVEGHLDPVQLAEMDKDDLKKLAKDMGVDLPRGAAKALIVERLAAAIVQTPAAAIVPPAADNGGGAQ